jgi:multidrug efflux system outer membrane protein
MVGPNYKRPDVAAPPQFRADAEPPAQTSLGEAKWFDLFQDETLRSLIKEALAANYDVRIAAERVLQAEGQLTATRSRLFPQLGVRAGAGRDGVNSPIESTGGILGITS